MLKKQRLEFISYVLMLTQKTHLAQKSDNISFASYRENQMVSLN